MRTERTPARAAGLLLMAAVLLAPLPLRGQLAGEACAGAGPACADGVVAAERLRDALAVGHGGGAVLPGSASTLGRRFSSTPRFALAGRVGFTDFDLPVPDRWGSGEEEGIFAPTFSATLGVGLTDGFSLAPTVGGVLAIDLLADLSTLRLPSGDGFDEASTAWGYGVRIGLLRESFTLPGASLSVMRRSGASTTLEGVEGRLESEVTSTSIRAVVGKEVLAWGLLAGVGWEDAEADWDLELQEGALPPFQLSRRDDDDTLFTAFGGLTRTFLILQLGLEAGWSDGVFFGSAGFRLTL